MKKSFCILFLLACTTVFAESKAVDPEIKEFLKRYYDAWNTMKSENADPFYAKDPELVFFDAAPFQYNSWQEYKEGAQKLFFDTTKTCKLIPNDDLKTYRHGDFAWFTLTFHLSAVMKDDSKTELDMRQTDVLEKRNGKWLIVHEHISIPLNLGPPQSSK